MIDDEKLRNLDKLSFEELADLTGQSSALFIGDGFPFNATLSLRGENVDSLIKELIHTLHTKKLCLKTHRMDAHLRVILANLIKGEEVSIEQSGLSKREWNELMEAFDLEDKSLK